MTSALPQPPEVPVPTMGVEEEFFLVDPRTRAPVPRAPDVIRALEPTLGEQVQAEFYRCQLELCTTPTASRTDLRDQLTALRAAGVDAARAAGCRLVASGTAVVPPTAPVPVTDTPRYRRMARRFRRLVDGRLGIVCGCHVHVGTADRAQALALANLLRPELPALQALLSNSPYDAGRESGIAGRRSVVFGRWPTVGPPPLLDVGAYEHTAAALVASGTVMDRRMIYWFARPSEHVPTLEVRVADANADVDMTVLLALLVRGLCLTALLDGTEAAAQPPVTEERLLRAHRYAARYGLRGEALDPHTGARMPAAERVADLFRRAAPGLVAAGDLDEAGRLLDRALDRGDGAARQRAVYRCRHRLREVVDALVVATAAA
ncbi:glutamate--cysteine ligase [Streptomyces sp. NPDC093225]|uniref:carboxylate-amine ligase n=1 Tax=Streptomyces sp. NPDC093225 TaxID=3366034 RepID=UPI00381FEF95